MNQSVTSKAQAPQLTVIQAYRRRSAGLSELWRFRNLAGMLALRDVRVRYKQSVLGIVWVLITPIVSMLIFSLVFGGIAKMPSEGFPYPVFLYSGLVVWNLFAAALQSSSMSMVQNAHLVGKVYFPRLLLPIASQGAALLDATIALLVLFAVMLWFSVPFSWGMLLLPLLFFYTVIIALSVGIGLAAMAAVYRDVGQMMGFLVRSWMLLTPVVYPVSALPKALLWLSAANPVSGLIELSRGMLLGLPVDWSVVITGMVVTAVLMVASLSYFSMVERRFADVI